MDDLYYEFDCGCRIKQHGTHIKESDGLPSLSLDFYNLPNCQKTWDLICTGKTKGVFQLETNLGQNWANKTEPHNLEELAALTAVIRPACLDSFIGGKSLTELYADRKTGRSEVESLHPLLTNILEETQQIILYQEDAIRIAREIAGFSLVRADILRKAIGKKDSDEMLSLKEEFIRGCIDKSGLNQKDATEIFSIIENSASYSFNKSILDSSLVETEDLVVKQIKDLSVGEKIYSPQGYVEVLNKFDHGIQDVFLVTLTNGYSIGCTILHKFLCEDGITRPLYSILYSGRYIKTDRADRDCWKIYKIEYLGKKHVVDIEVNSDEHLFYANGIATSNSHSVAYGSTFL